MSKRKLGIENEKQNDATEPAAKKAMIPVEYYCEPFLRKCFSTMDLKYKPDLDVKGLQQFDDKDVCERTCQLPDVLDPLFLEYIGDVGLYENKRFEAKQNSIAYVSNKRVQSAIERIVNNTATSADFVTIQTEWKQGLGLWNVEKDVLMLWAALSLDSMTAIRETINILRMRKTFSVNDWFRLYVKFIGASQSYLAIGVVGEWLFRWFSNFYDDNNEFNSATWQNRILPDVQHILETHLTNDFDQKIDEIRKNFFDPVFAESILSGYKSDFLSSYLQYLPDSILQLMIRQAIQDPSIPFPFDALLGYRDHNALELQYELGPLITTSINRQTRSQQWNAWVLRIIPSLPEQKTRRTFDEFYQDIKNGKRVTHQEAVQQQRAISIHNLKLNAPIFDDEAVAPKTAGLFVFQKF